MASFNTTATLSADAHPAFNLEFTSRSNLATFCISNSDFTGVGGAAAKDRYIANFRIPSQPVGADSINSIKLVLTYKQSTAGAGSSWLTKAKQLNFLPWTESFVSWNSMASNVRWPNNTISGSTGALLSFQTITPGTISSFSWDITGLNLSWGDHGSVFITAATFGVTLNRSVFFSDEYSTSTTSFYPHTVVTFTDNPPDAINDLIASPDVSLSEARRTRTQASNPDGTEVTET